MVSTSEVSNCCYRRSRRKTSGLGCPLNEMTSTPSGFGFNTSCIHTSPRVPCTARRSNQSILKEISPGISLEGMMLKLKLQYLGHLM